MLILGQHNPEVPYHIVFRGAVFADYARFDRCIDLWLHALNLKQLNDVSVVKDLLRFAQVLFSNTYKYYNVFMECFLIYIYTLFVFSFN